MFSGLELWLSQEPIADITHSIEVAVDLMVLSTLQVQEQCVHIGRLGSRPGCWPLRGAQGAPLPPPAKQLKHGEAGAGLAAPAIPHVLPCAWCHRPPSEQGGKRRGLLPCICHPFSWRVAAAAGAARLGSFLKGEAALLLLALKQHLAALLPWMPGQWHGWALRGLFKQHRLHYLPGVRDRGMAGCCWGGAMGGRTLLGGCSLWGGRALHCRVHQRGGTSSPVQIADKGQGRSRKNALHAKREPPRRAFSCWSLTSPSPPLVGGSSRDGLNSLPISLS